MRSRRPWLLHMKSQKRPFVRNSVCSQLSGVIRANRVIRTIRANRVIRANRKFK